MRSALVPAVCLVLMSAFVALPHQAYAQSSEPNYTVSGVVLDSDGEPLEGAQVSAYVESGAHDKRLMPSDGWSATTDASGAFALRLPAGKGSLTAYHEPYRRSATSELSVTGNVTGLELVIETPPPRTAIVEGVVRDPAGKPIEGATVTLGYGCCSIMAHDGGETSGGAERADASSTSVMPAIWPPPYDEGAQATTGADGSYRFTTYAGERQLTAAARGFAQTTSQVVAKENATVTADITLVKAPASDALLKGVVRDARTGAPIANAQVSVRSMEWGRHAWDATGADGSYEVRLVPGWTAIEVYAGGGEPMPVEGDTASSPTKVASERYYAFSEVLRISSGANPHDIALEPRPEPTIALVGYVVDPDAQAGVAGAYVSFWNQDTGDWGSAVTDKTGSFRILVRPGHYSANAWLDGYLGGQTTFVVAPEGATQRIDIPMPKGQPRYAPCEGNDCPQPEPMPLAAKSMDASAGAPATQGQGAEAGAPGERAPEGPVAFEGSGGGLPAYDPARASEVPSSSSAQAAPVPLLGVGALVVPLVAVAVALRRR